MESASARRHSYGEFVGMDAPINELAVQPNWAVAEADRVVAELEQGGG